MQAYSVNGIWFDKGYLHQSFNVMFIQNWRDKIIPEIHVYKSDGVQNPGNARILNDELRKKFGVFRSERRYVDIIKYYN